MASPPVHPPDGIPDGYSCAKVSHVSEDLVGSCAPLNAAINKCLEDNQNQFSKCQKGEPFALISNTKDKIPVCAKNRRPLFSKSAATLFFCRIESVPDLFSKEQPEMTYTDVFF